jgi:MFS transporter, ACS family, pantothenate transporter
LLIGSSASALDIARELGPRADTIYQSHRNGTYDVSASLFVDNAVRVDEVISFDPPASHQINSPLGDEESIPATITLKSGRKLCEIDQVIFCTGYHVTLPFLPYLHSDSTKPEKAGDTLLVTDGYQIHNLHKDIFYIKDPSLIFVGVPYYTATFTLFEFQAIVVAKVLSRQVSLPSERVMRVEYESKVKEKGYGKTFHSLRNQEVEYVDELLNWVNADLQKKGEKNVAGHTDTWHRARAEQKIRMEALFTKETIQKEILVACS